MSQDPRRPPAAARPAQGEQLPFEPGQVVGRVPRTAVTGDSLTPLERQVLEQGGAVEGEVPDLSGTEVGQRLAAQIERARQAADPEHVEGTPVPADTPPVPPPKITNIQDLDPRQQAEVRQRLESFRAQQQHEAAGTPPENIRDIPGMDEAYQAAVHGGPLPPIEVVDDLSRPQAASQSQAAQEPAAAFDPREGAQPEPPAMQPAQIGPGSDDYGTRAEPPPPPPPPEPPDAGGFDPTEPDQPEEGPDRQQGEQQQNQDAGGKTVRPANCPRCGWDLAAQVVEPSVQDKLAYAATVLGEGRFRKEYAVFDRRIVFTLRSLLPSELDLAQHQLAWDTRENRIATPAEYDYMFNNYKLAMSIERLHRAGQAPLTFKPVATLPRTQDRTPLPSLTAWFNEHVYTTDTVRRVIGQQWLQFGKLMDHLEARAPSPDFWKEIEGLL